jgi:DNA-binding winged helix-turn-helix (wHTH) protein
VLFQFDNLLIDPDRREIKGVDGVVHVEPQVFDLLLHFVQNTNRVITKDELIESVWKGRAVSDAALNSRINEARRAIGDTGERQALIRTVQRRGFLFAADVTTRTSGQPLPPHRARGRRLSRRSRHAQPLRLPSPATEILAANGLLEGGRRLETFHLPGRIQQTPAESAFDPGRWGGGGVALSRASQSPEGGGSLLGFERLAEGDLPAIVGDGTWKAVGDTTMPP